MKCPKCGLSLTRQVDDILVCHNEHKFKLVDAQRTHRRNQKAIRRLRAAIKKKSNPHGK